MINSPTDHNDKNILVLDGWKFISIPDGIFEIRLGSAPPTPSRINLSVSFLFLDCPAGRFLVDTGLGNLPDPIFHRHKRTPFRPMAEKLRDYAIRIAELDGLIFTHLHNDHIGGYLMLNGHQAIPVFAQLPCYINQDEWEFRLSRMKNMPPVVRQYYDAMKLQVCLNRCPEKLFPDIEVLFCGGHTPGHQVILFHTGQHVVCYAGDIVSTEVQLVRNLNLPYDHQPEKSDEIRRQIYRRALAEKWIFILGHAPHNKFVFLETTAKNEYISLSFPP